MQAKIKVGFTTRVIFGTGEGDIEEKVSEIQKNTGLPCRVLYFIDVIQSHDDSPSYPELEIRYSRNNRPL